MRAWTIAWIAVVAVCIAATIYEIPNAQRLWRLRGVLREDRRTASGKLNIPTVVTDKLVAADPEAGDMLRCLLAYSNGEASIEDLAVLVGKYPQNEFLLSQLAQELARLNLVDSQVALLIADRLLKLNADNAHYRYLRAWILLTDPNRVGREREASEEFELGHRQPQFYLPYSMYKERLDRLYEKGALFWERPSLRPFYMDLVTPVFRSDQLRKRLDENVFHDLSGSVVKIADRLLENAYDSETLLAGTVLLGAGEAIRLRELDLPEAEAQQSRLRAAQGLALLGVFGQSSFLDIAPTINTVLIAALAASLLVSTGYSLLAGPLAFLFAGLRLRRHESKVCKNIKPWLLIDAGLVAILVLLEFWEFAKNRPEGELPVLVVFLAAIFIPWSTVLLHLIHPVNVARLRRPRFCLAALCLSMWFKGAVFWTSGSLNVPGPVWVRYGLVLLAWSVLCVLVWAEVAYQSDLFMAKHRGAVTLIVEWVVLLMVLGVFGPFYVQMERSFSDPLSQYGPLPKATQETYQRVVLGQGLGETQLERGPRTGLPGRLEYAAPQDLRAFIAERRAGRRAIPEQQLQKMLRDCNRDLRPILLAELADPNSYDVLVIRAEWGDRTVKEQLDRIFQERLATFRESKIEPRPRDPSSLGELLELAGTLARVSDGREAQERFSYLTEQVVARTRSLGTGPSLDDPRYNERAMQPFWESLGKLPPALAMALVKSYLRQTQFVDLVADRGGAITRLADLLANGDRELAEEVVGAPAELPDAADSPDAPFTESEQQRTMRLTRYRDKNAPLCLEAIFTHLTAESIPLLLKHLESDNDQLRAFIVWRLTSLGYQWTDEQLAALRQDSYWKVRVNALFALDSDHLAAAVEDENPLVRTVARMLVQSD